MIGLAIGTIFFTVSGEEEGDVVTITAMTEEAGDIADADEAISDIPKLVS